MIKNTKYNDLQKCFLKNIHKIKQRSVKKCPLLIFYQNYGIMKENRSALVKQM